MPGLGGIGLGAVGAGWGLNAMGMGGGGAMDGVNKELAGMQRDVQGGFQYGGTQGAASWADFLNAARRNGQTLPGRADPQAGAAAQAQTSGFRANQQDLISRLEALSKGQGPSLAAEQLRQATDRNMKQQSSIAQTGRGNAALAGIQASNMSGQLGAQAASDSAMARIAEQQMALQQLGGVINQGRTSDQDLSQFNALQTNYRDQFNIEAQLRARGMNDEQIRAIMAMKMQAAQAKDQASMGNQLMAGGAGLLSLSGSNTKGPAPMSAPSSYAYTPGAGKQNWYGR